MEVLEHFRFGVRWRGWISSLLSSSSTSILLNGSRGKWYKHFRGLRQGDPLSPMLFILAMEPLQQLLDLATANSALTPINNRVAKLRTSMWADDAALFINPIKEEVQVVAKILHFFGEVTGWSLTEPNALCSPSVVITLMWLQPWKVLRVRSRSSHVLIWACLYIFDNYIVWKFSQSLTRFQPNYQHGRADSLTKPRDWNC
jgi:hypothetical protein